MSLEALLTRTATLRRYGPGTEDAHGNPARTLLETRSVKVYLEQQAPRELLIGRETYIATHRAVLPAGTPAAGTDTLEVDGTVFEIIGPVSHAHRPATGEHHLELELREST